MADDPDPFFGEAHNTAGFVLLQIAVGARNAAIRAAKKANPDITDDATSKIGWQAAHDAMRAAVERLSGNGLDDGPPWQPVGEIITKPVFTPTPFVPTDPSTFPRRQFLYGRHYARRYLSATVAAGDVGKTSLDLAEAVAMASGVPLLGVHVRRPLRVWYWNGEDPREEIVRRVLAICKHYQIDQEKLAGNLYLDSGRDMKLIVAEMVGRGLQIAIPVKEALIAALIASQSDVLAVDPFVKVHRVSENDNVIMDAVATVFADIADAANCAVELAQHSRKTGGADVNIEDMRGGSALAAAVRMARALNRITSDDAVLAGVKEDQCRFHVRIDDDAKSNLAPPEKATWFKLIGIGLGNAGEDPVFDREDYVQVAVRWQWPSVFEGVGIDVLREVQRLVKERSRRADQRATDWIGFVIIDVLHLDRDSRSDRAKAKAIFAAWIKNRMFKIIDGVSEDRKKCRLVVVDEAAN
jgi:hypothetical protein